MLRISILGSGWLGLPLAKHFSKKYSIKVSTRSELRFNEIKDHDLNACIFDIENIDNSNALFLDADILVINITSKNIQAFNNLITKIENSLIQKVLFISSTSVYPNVNKVLTEDDGLELPESKLFQIENLFRKNNFDTTVLRLSGLIGYSRHPGNWFKTKAVSQADAPVNLIHRDDCIGLIEAVIQQDIWGEVFNGCADTHPTKRQYYAYARELLRLEKPDFESNELLSYKIVSNVKAKKMLAYNYIYPNVMGITFD